ncbi:hypothetical protein GGH96_003400, partial [Coemansia sp. RSA 1972]
MGINYLTRVGGSKVPQLPAKRPRSSGSPESHKSPSATEPQHPPAKHHRRDIALDVGVETDLQTLASLIGAEQPLAAPGQGNILTLPVGFPEPPAHAGDALGRFKTWAYAWRERNGESAASAILAGRLMNFVSACNTHNKSEIDCCAARDDAKAAKTQQGVAGKRLDDARADVEAAVKRLDNAGDLAKSSAAQGSSPPAWVLSLFEMASSGRANAQDAVKKAQDAVEKAQDAVEKAGDTVQCDKAKLDEAAKAVDELVYLPPPAP